MGKRKKREKPSRRDRTVDYLKGKIVEDFRRVREGLLELSKYQSRQEALQFGLNLIQLCNMGLDEAYERALKM